MIFVKWESIHDLRAVCQMIVGVVEVENVDDE